MPDFIPGLALAGRFYAEAVRPILDRRFPGLPHSAALIGFGSEVLGFDTAVSTDHHWGPRVMLFLREVSPDGIGEALARELPHRFLGWPTSFTFPRPDDGGVRLLQPRDEGPVDHMVELHTLRRFFVDYLAWAPDGPLAVADWLTLPSQRLRGATAGAVFHDDLGLEEVRRRLAWYPRDVWLYLLAAGWTRVGQEEHLMGRAGQAGDEIGSALIAARLVRDLMRLCFLLERVHAPYPKWFGTAFARLDVGATLGPVLTRVLQAHAFPERGEALAEAYRLVAARQNALGLTEPIRPETRDFADWHPRGDLPAPILPPDRPFPVLHAGRFADALRKTIDDPAVRAIPYPIGGIDQWSDSTDLVDEPKLRERLKVLFRLPERSPRPPFLHGAGET